MENENIPHLSPEVKDRFFNLAKASDRRRTAKVLHQKGDYQQMPKGRLNGGVRSDLILTLPQDVL